MQRWACTELRIFLDGALLSYVALFRWLRPPTYVASKLAMPLAQLLFFAFLGMYATGAGTVSYYLVGNAVQLAAVNGIYGVTMTVGNERWEGTLVYLIGSPAHRLSLFVGRAFMHVLDGTISVVIAFGWGILLFGLDLSHTDLRALALTIAITTLSTSGLGLFMGAISLMTVNVMFVNNTVYFVLLVLCGVNVPIEKLPPYLAILSPWLPLTRGIEAARRLFSGTGLAEVWPLLAGELLVGLVYVVLGFLCFQWFELQARRRGTLEAM